MVQRKPVFSQRTRDSTSPAALYPSPEPASPHIASPPSLRTDLKSSPASADHDWDTCDDEEQDLIDLSPAHSAHEPAPSSQQLQAGPRADPVAVHANGRGKQPLNVPQINVAKDVNDSTPSAPAFLEPKQRRNTNPFRKGPEKQPSTGHDLPSHVWDDHMYVDQSGAKRPVDSRFASPSGQPASPVPTSPLYPAANASPGIHVTSRIPPSSVAGVKPPSSPSLALPPRSIQTQATSSSPAAAQQPVVDSPPATTDRKQRNEFYHIKHIRWFDAASTENPRHSPILIQNANGPCPLLALVNCLVLTTPANLNTALIEALRTREQISIGLLLDAVFDELISDRRCGSANELPDVGELYSFLVTLHTGMNVNPRFVPSANLRRLPSGAEDLSPGSFEETREMKLYGTFSIPLIHGWLPHRNESAFGAFERVAQTYEEVQNAQFREEELEAKLSSNQASGEDQQLLNDLRTIKQFLFYWPTQLTAHGLDVIDRFLGPGQMAILFRNDHFSSVLKEPYSNRLMTLVTDAGYSTHDEIVWESLVDISGASSEFCSGDFRSVSHEAEPDASLAGPIHDDADGWTTVERKSGRNSRPGAPAKVDEKQQSSPQKLKVPQQPAQPLEATSEVESSTAFDLTVRSARARTASEQEDHDLALALQLQEEEEERQRNEAAARRARENDLSEEFISRESARQGGPVRIPVRRSGQSQAGSSPSTYAPPSEPHPSNVAQSSAPARSNAPTVRPAESGSDAPPPTYEQAAAEAAFHPPRSHPASEHAPIPSATSSVPNTTTYGVASGQNSRPFAPGTTGPRRMSARQTLMEQSSVDPRGRARAVDPPFGTTQASRDSDKCLVM